MKTGRGNCLQWDKHPVSYTKQVSLTHRAKQLYNAVYCYFVKMFFFWFFLQFLWKYQSLQVILYFCLIISFLKKNNQILFYSQPILHIFQISTQVRLLRPVTISNTRLQIITTDFGNWSLAISNLAPLKLAYTLILCRHLSEWFLIFFITENNRDVNSTIAAALLQNTGQSAVVIGQGRRKVTAK